MTKPGAWLLGLALWGFAAADEGMWLFNQPPSQALRRDYGFDLTPAWLDKVMKSSVRFNNGGSGGFVSADGLVVTNHHIGSDALQKLSRPGRDLLQSGYLAKNRQQELPCSDVELNVLQSIEDVTALVEATQQPGQTPEQAANARRAKIAELEKSQSAQSGLHCQVVTLYLGGAYHLYRYRRYSDVRLVMAPEQAVAFYGGDVDNFEYPRYNFDCCFFRVYDQGQPLRSQAYLPWSQQGVQEGDLVFVSGHPGRTNRLETLARLQHLRDQTLPFRLTAWRNQELALRLYSQQGPEQQRQAQAELYSLANARKAYTGQIYGLLDGGLMASKAQREQELRLAVGEQPTPSAWEQIAKAQEQLSAYEKDYYLLEQRLALQGSLFEWARHLVRWSQEKSKSNGDRLREYRDSNLESLWQDLLSPAPFYPEFEVAQLTASLSLAAETWGATHPGAQIVLNGISPEARAYQLVHNSPCARLATRRRYRELAPEELRAQGDPMIELAFQLDEISRKIRHRYELEVVEPELKAYAWIARAQLAQQGQQLAPDATFSLRLSYGKVAGYSVAGRRLAFATRLGENFANARLHRNQPPFQLPARWWEREKSLNLKLPYNFVSTADTIGGNSGSPVLNRRGELVGLNFDRNRHGLSRNFLYTEVQARHIAVHSPAILELLSKIYQAPALVEELKTGQCPSASNN